MKNYKINIEVDNLFSTFNIYKSINTKNIKDCIIDLIYIFNLGNYCNKIIINDNNNYYGLYNYKQKEICINQENIISKLLYISKSNDFINVNIYRIILHEIKHILQHEMIDSKKDLYNIYDHEFNSRINHSIIKPSEINAELESSIYVLNLLDKESDNYIKQLSYLFNLIKKIYFEYNNSIKYCIDNNIKYSTIGFTDYEIFVNGLTNKLEKNKILKIIT